MDNTYLDLLNKTFADPSQLTLDSLKVFINETVRFFSEVKEMLTSGDTAAKEMALSMSTKVKETLENKMDEICKLTGLTADQLSVMAGNANNMSSEEYNLVQEAKNQFVPFVGDTSHNAGKGAKPLRKAVKTGLVG